MTVLLLLPGGMAHAVGTTAGVSIDNRATVDFQVGGIPQTPIESAPGGNSTPGVGNGADTSFLVDNMLDLTVAETGASYTSVTPGATAQVLTFSLTNTGNNVQDFSLAAVNRVAGTGGPFGGTDSFDAAAFSVFVDGNGNGTYEAATDTATFIDELAADTAISVFIVSTIPLGVVDGDLAVLTLTGQVAQGGVPTVQGADILADDAGIPDDPATIQTVFADGAGDTDGAADGQHSDSDGYQVTSARLTITKSSAVISDPINGGVNPKAIPGAVIEYTVTIANDVAATASATGITVSDDLSTEIGAGTIVFINAAYGAGPDRGIRVASPTVAGDQTTALDADNGDFNGTAPNTVTVTGIDLLPGESGTVQYRVQVQ